MTLKQLICTAVLSILAAVFGFFIQPVINNAEKNSAASIIPHHLSSEVILLNFWATWCPPCRKEIPDFIRLHQELQGQGFSVIGVAIDKEEKVRAFEQEMGVNYPSFIVEKEGYSLMEEYGSLHGALPYSVVLDRQGSVIYKHHKGVLSYTEAKKIIEPLL